MIKQLSSVVLGAALIFLTTGQSDAGILSIGNYIGEPGDVVTATIDLSSLGGVDFTSMDIALEILPSVGDGDSPTLGTGSASTAEGWVWSPFDSVNDSQQTFNGTDTLAVYGISGLPAGTTSTLDGTVIDIPITVPAGAVNGDVFVLDLIEVSSNISNNGNALPSMAGWDDGSITVIPEPTTGLMFALSLFGFGVIFRRSR